MKLCKTSWFFSPFWHQAKYNKIKEKGDTPWSRSSWSHHSDIQERRSIICQLVLKQQHVLIKQDLLPNLQLLYVYSLRRLRYLDKISWDAFNFIMQNYFSSYAMQLSSILFSSTCQKDIKRSPLIFTVIFLFAFSMRVPL